MKKWFLGLILSTQVLAGPTVLGVSQSKEIITDKVQCDGDIFCVDHMRETCNSRKETINLAFDEAVRNDEDLKRADLKAIAAIRKNGSDDAGDPQDDIKKVECKINVTSLNLDYKFSDSLSAKSQRLSDCQDIMQKNLQDKRVLFQEIQEGRTLFVRKFCRVYLLELIKN